MTRLVHPAYTRYDFLGIHYFVVLTIGMYGPLVHFITIIVNIAHLPSQYLRDFQDVGADASKNYKIIGNLIGKDLWRSSL